MLNILFWALFQFEARKNFFFIHNKNRHGIKNIIYIYIELMLLILPFLFLFRKI